MSGDSQSSSEKPSRRRNDPMNCDDITNEEDKEEETCPLFMEGLPKDFATNPALAAIANLLTDDEPPPPNNDDEQRNEPKRPTTTGSLAESGGGGGGGGKASSSHRNHRVLSGSVHRRKPYNIPMKPPKKATTTLGEAQLFLQMWKM